MTLTDQINEDIKSAMKAKDRTRLDALRAIKSALLLASTEKGAGESSVESDIKLLQKLVKQRKDAEKIFLDQGRNDLAEVESDQIAIIENYLPAGLSEDEVKAIIKGAIDSTNASSMADMGKVMGIANQKIAGRADGKFVAEMVKTMLV